MDPTTRKRVVKSKSATDQNIEYIRLLEERNRIAKELERKRKSAQDKLNEQREKEFKLYTSGANEKDEPQGKPKLRYKGDRGRGAGKTQWQVPDRTLQFASQGGQVVRVKGRQKGEGHRRDAPPGGRKLRIAGLDRSLQVPGGGLWASEGDDSDGVHDDDEEEGGSSGVVEETLEDIAEVSDTMQDASVSEAYFDDASRRDRSVADEGGVPGEGSKQSMAGDAMAGAEEGDGYSDESFESVAEDIATEEPSNGKPLITMETATLQSSRDITTHEESKDKPQEVPPLPTMAPSSPPRASATVQQSSQVASIMSSMGASDLSALRDSLRASVDRSRRKDDAPGVPPLPTALRGIFQMIQALDEEHKQQLLAALNISASSPQGPAAPSADMPRAVSPVDTSTLTSSRRSNGSGAQPSGTAYKLHLLSTWDGGSVCGLTEIDVLDRNRQRIPLPSTAVSLLSLSDPSAQGSLGALVDGHRKTTKEVHMWACPSSIARKADEPLATVQVCVPEDQATPWFMEVWNYNRSLRMAGIGVKHLSVEDSNGGIVWEGIIEKGAGNTYFKSATLLPLNAQAAAALQQQRQEEERLKALDTERRELEAQRLGSRLLSSRGSARSTAEDSAEASGPLYRSQRLRSSASSRRSSGSNDAAMAAGAGHSPSAAAAGRYLSPRAAPKQQQTQERGSPQQKQQEEQQQKEAEEERQNKSVSPLQLPSKGSGSEGHRPIWLPEDAPLSSRSASPSKEEDMPRSGRRSARSRRSAKGAAIPSTTSSSSSPAQPSSSATRGPASTPIEVPAPSSVPQQRARGTQQPQRGGAARESWDSLEFFSHSHRGRLPTPQQPHVVPTDRPSSTTRCGSRGSQPVLTKTGSDILLPSASAASSPPQPLLAPRAAQEAAVAAADTAPQEPQPSASTASMAAPLHRRRSGAALMAERLLSSSDTGSSGERPAPQQQRHTGAQAGRMKEEEEGGVEAEEGERQHLDDSANSFAVGDDTGAAAPAAGGGAAGPNILDDLITETAEAERPLPSVADRNDADGMQRAHYTEPDLASSSFMDDEGLGASQGDVDDEDSMEASHCDIPSLPKGRVLTLKLLSTWGDPYYIGLAGLDIFDGNGKPIRFADPKTSITADPADINVLPEYDGDPRTVDNLLDGQNHTSDDMHVWLAPYTAGKPATVTITLPGPGRTTISMVRVWNYNKSRIHSYRGVRRMAIMLDGVTIFDGEVRKAPGAAGATVGQVEECSEVILFTRDEVILGAVERWDPQGEEGDPTPEIVQQLMKAKELHRPGTGDAGARAASRASTRLEHGNDSGTLRRKTRAPTPPETYREVSSRESGLYHLGPTSPQEAMEADGPLRVLGTGGKRPTTAAVSSPTQSRDAEEDLMRGVDTGGHGRGTAAATEAISSAQGGQMLPLVASPPPAGALSSAGRTAEVAAKAVVPAAPRVAVGDAVLVRSLRDVVVGRKLRLSIEDTWGDRYYAGLCGIQILTLRPSAGVPLHRFLASVGAGRGGASSLSEASAVALTAAETSARITRASTRKPRPSDTRRQGEDFPTLAYLWNERPKDNAVTSEAQVYTIEEHPLSLSNVAAMPPDININGHSGDPRTLDKLVDGHNITNDDLHMWLIPWDPPGTRTRNSKTPLLEIDLGEDTYILGMRVWNYNKSEDDTDRGVADVSLDIDGHGLAPPRQRLLFRRAPGVASYDYGQTFLFRRSGGTDTEWAIDVVAPNVSHEQSRGIGCGRMRGPTRPIGYSKAPVVQDYETPRLPSGCVWKFVFGSTHGDPYYLGLNGLALYDAEGRYIPLHPSQIFASPHSVNDLEGSAPLRRLKDGRVPHNLANAALGLMPRHAAAENCAVPQADTARALAASGLWSDGITWLAPLAHSLVPGTQNELFIVFDQPITVSMIKLWNYSKTPGRGVAEVSVFVDSNLIHSGSVPASKVSQFNSGKTRLLKDVAASPHSIVFTSAPDLLEDITSQLDYCGKRDQVVALINEGRLMGGSPEALQGIAPTAVGFVADLTSRPTTSLVGPK